jgi:hypothetical protein
LSTEPAFSKQRFASPERKASIFRQTARDVRKFDALDSTGVVVPAKSKALLDVGQKGAASYFFDGHFQF